MRSLVCIRHRLSLSFMNLAIMEEIEARLIAQHYFDFENELKCDILGLLALRLGALPGHS
jgi:hypothetical protein